ncbi:ketopantoate reductase family protein [Streptomyces poriticola]|uniref:ketopantoate reductase family protein n=1 Tax=Streptomyces poriticola TaxID=3120506 RepID=UPI002FCE5B1F
MRPDPSPAAGSAATAATAAPAPAAASPAAPPPGGGTVAVLGPGGVGGLLAALLARSGQRVVCIAGAETVRALRTDGLRVRSRQYGDFTARVEADTVLREAVGLCLVTVKHTALESALRRIPAGALGGAPVLPLLNGVDHVPSLRTRYGAENVIPAVIRVESARTAPGLIEHGSPFTEVDLASPAEQVDRTVESLTAAGVSTRVMADADALLWAKLAFLAPFALLTTYHRVPVGVLRTELRAELAALVEEAAAVSRAACGTAPGTAEMLARYDAFPPRSRSSMQRDAEAGRPLELDAIGGALLRAAARHGVPVPVTTGLVAELAARS